MRTGQPLIALLRGLADLLADESQRNPDFAAKLDALTKPPQTVTETRAKPATKPATKRKEAVSPDLPDIHNELAARGEADFRAWLNALPIDVLKALIRREDLDPARRASKWKDQKKLAGFLADGVRARMARGAAFMGRTPISERGKE
jgi:hypothetical protein